MPQNVDIETFNFYFFKVLDQELEVEKTRKKYLRLHNYDEEICCVRRNLEITCSEGNL